MKNNKGFTLIELIAVLTIMGIIAGLTVPSLMNMTDKWMLRSTANMIANDIRLVQSMSIQECTEYQFELLTSRFTYQLKLAEFTKLPFKTVKLDPRITKLKSTLYDPGLKGIYKDDRLLIFSYLGSPNQAGTIELESKSGNRIKITIVVNTGRVQVIE